MLFHSFFFMTVFLPLTLVGFQLARHSGGPERAVAWLVVSSLVFYAWWSPPYLLLLAGSLVMNYGWGRLLLRAITGGASGKTILVFGVVLNLTILGYFKYAHFFVENINLLTDAQWRVGDIFLPLAVSFFTFQQIAFLADVYQGRVREIDFGRYSLFVVFFPQLISGPIVHYREMAPQFADPDRFRITSTNLAAGLTLFIIGLFKKTVLADGLEISVIPVFDGMSGTDGLTAYDAWKATLAYTLQLYFDFSGYTDMALGLAAVFGVRLPINFDSPFKATSILDFWRRWHITLSRFFLNHVYIPLGGNRRGRVRRGVNLLITMILGGLWHGAGWTFIVWGALHGVYMLINLAWRKAKAIWLIGAERPPSASRRFCARTITFTAFAVSLVFFRSPDVPHALGVLKSMIGMNVPILPTLNFYPEHLHRMDALYLALGLLCSQPGILVFGPVFYGLCEAPVLLLLLAAVWTLPNSQQLLRDFEPALYMDEKSPERETSRPGWKPNTGWAILLGVVAFIAVVHIDRLSKFLYFQF